MTIEIYDSYGTLLKTIAKNEYKNAGIHRFEWDGTSEDGYSTDEPYKFVITAVGNSKTETKTGLISHDAAPSWLEDIQYSLNEGEYYPTGFDLMIKTKENITLKVILEDDYSILATKTYTVQKGSNTVTYTKPIEYQDDYYRYTIELKDALGNKYQYYIEEYEY
jgi:hypothetical protein